MPRSMMSMPCWRFFVFQGVEVGHEVGREALDAGGGFYVKGTHAIYFDRMGIFYKFFLRDQQD